MDILTAMYICNKDMAILRLNGLDVYIDNTTMIKNFKGKVRDLVCAARNNKLRIDRIKYDCYFKETNCIRKVHYIRFSNI